MKKINKITQMFFVLSIAMISLAEAQVSAWDINEQRAAIEIKSNADMSPNERTFNLLNKDLSLAINALFHAENLSMNLHNAENPEAMHHMLEEANANLYDANRFVGGLFPKTINNLQKRLAIAKEMLTGQPRERSPFPQNPYKTVPQSPIMTN